MSCLSHLAGVLQIYQHLDYLPGAGILQTACRGAETLMIGFHIVVPSRVAVMPIVQTDAGLARGAGLGFLGATIPSSRFSFF